MTQDHKALFESLFDKSAAAMATLSNRKDVPPEAATNSKRLSENFKAMFVATQAGGVNGLSDLLSDPEKLRQKGIAPDLAERVRSMVDDQVSGRKGADKLQDSMNDVVNGHLKASVGVPPMSGQIVSKQPTKVIPATEIPTVSAAKAAAPEPAAGPAQDFAKVVAKRSKLKLFGAGVAAAALTLLGIGAAIDHYKFNQRHKSSIPERDYGDVRDLHSGAQGGTKAFVDMSVGAGMGVLAKLGPVNGKPAGFTPQQYLSFSLGLRDDKVKERLAEGMAKDKHGQVTLAQNEDHKFELVRPGSEEKYKDKLQVKVDLTAAETQLTVTDPATGRGPVTSTYANPDLAQASLNADPKARAEAQKKVLSRPTGPS